MSSVERTHCALSTQDFSVQSTNTYASSGVQEGNVSEVGPIEADMSGMLDIALRAGYHAALDRPLARVRVPFDVRAQQGRADRPRRVADRMR